MYLKNIIIGILLSFLRKKRIYGEENLRKYSQNILIGIFIYLHSKYFEWKKIQNLSFEEGDFDIEEECFS